MRGVQGSSLSSVCCVLSWRPGGDFLSRFGSLNLTPCFVVASCIVLLSLPP